MLKVLIVDDHAIVRKGLREILRSYAVVATIGEAATAALGLEQIRATDWDIVILDIGLPGRSGIEVLQQVKLEQSDLPIIMLSVYNDVPIMQACLNYGASGYLVKESAPEELITALQVVSQGGTYISRRFSDWMSGDSTRLTTGESSRPAA